MGKSKSGLKLKQKHFVDWYVKLANGTQAAIKAGYSEKTAQEQASRLLSNVMVRAYYHERLKHIEEILGFNKATVVQDLMEVRDRSLQRVPVMKYNPRTKENEQVKDEEGRDVWQFDSNGANRAIENINKMMGYNEPDKVEDVTPPEKKSPTIVVVNKSYATDKPDQPTQEAN